MFGRRSFFFIKRLYSQKVSSNVHDNMFMGYRKYPKSDTPGLINSFGNHVYLKISLTERCNLRCDYCLPESGITLKSIQHFLKTYEILQLAELFVRQSVTKITLTGGEPTLHKDLKFIIENLTSTDGIETVAMTTNVLTLTECLSDLKKAGLNALSISLDSRQQNVETITRRKGLSKDIKGIDYPLELNCNPVEMNCVIMNNGDEILDFVELTKERTIHELFIKYMPLVNTHAELISKLDKNIQIFKLSILISTKLLYSVPGFAGRVRFISPINKNFFEACKRLKLDGSLKVCLLDSAEISVRYLAEQLTKQWKVIFFIVRDALRNGFNEDDILAIVRAAVMRKKKQHADFLESNTSKLLSRIPIHHKKSMQVQCYSTLSHVDCSGKATMIDVSSKEMSSRFSSAYAEVHIGSTIVQMIRDNEVKKGDVLSVAKLAGIMGAKKTSSLIPLCHTIALSFVDVQLEITDQCIKIISKVRCCGQTGVEMEALTAVTVAALTIYDMCKVVSHDIIIQKVRLLEKTGGKHEFLTKLE